MNYMKWKKEATKVILRATTEQLNTILRLPNAHYIIDDGKTQIPSNSLTVVGFPPTNMMDDVVKEYQNAVERDEFLAREIADLETSVAKLEGLISELNEQLHERFVVGIDKITLEFNRFFVLMFGGGKAELKRIKPKIKKLDDEGLELLEEEEDETQEGVEIDVLLPNKRVKGLEMLSGGERALTSIALIFAMSQVNPPLFVILDETDAALDEADIRLGREFAIE